MDIFLGIGKDICNDGLGMQYFSDHNAFLADISIEIAKPTSHLFLGRVTFSKVNWQQFNCQFGLFFDQKFTGQDPGSFFLQKLIQRVKKQSHKPRSEG